MIGSVSRALVWVSPLVVTAAVGVCSVRAVVPVGTGGLHEVRASDRVRQDMVAVRSCRAGVRPDPLCTPGAVDPSLTREQVCVGGVRTRLVEAGRWREELARVYGLAGADAELDYAVPPALGGVNAVSNLWVRPTAQGEQKKAVEGQVRAAVCSGAVPLRAAQEALARDWTTAPQQLGLR